MKAKILFLALLLGSYHVFSQQFKGKVLNANKKPLENVYVYNMTSNSHTHTKVSGEFILDNSKEGDVIEFGILGYEKVRLQLNESNFKTINTIVLEMKNFLLDEMVLTNKKDPLQTIVRVDLDKKPVSSSQQILQRVPGLFIGQHAGGGKAEQIFLRGFDIDHGTDIALSVDGTPVNMVSHAHGQGYSDLHFIIPETIEKINFGKGPYYASKGDFNTAGYVDFKTKTYLQNSRVEVGVGQFNTFRTLGMFNLLDKNSTDNAYVAIEYLETDGFVESPQNFSRINIFTKYRTFLKDNSSLSLSASHFTSKWDASGQIPQREVDNGNITRFGSIDDTEGGTTSRTNINLEHSKVLKNDVSVTSNVFYSNYNFNLFSNFTFFLEDPVNGDQIKQTENRDVFGFNTQFKKKTQLSNTPVELTFGTGLRADIVDNLELSHTLQRKEVLDQIQLGKVNQTNYYAFVYSEFEFGKFMVAPALRLDYLKFNYNDYLLDEYKTFSESQVVVNPKINVIYTPNAKIQWFLKSGIGFHSNDTRVVATQPNRKTLPRAYGVDFGTVWKPTSRIAINTALWYLLSEDELVYVGDAGIVEPSGESQRYGIDLGLRYQLTDWLYFDSDATYTKAESVNALSGENYIPLAPKITVTGGLSVNSYKNFSGGINYRYIGDRPANEDNSIVAEGYFVTDANVSYKMNNITVGVALENLFDVVWNETQFATESRLQNEPNPVEEIHFTPGTPFSVKASIRYTF
ncbi:TonB-dependent receptor [Tenacibaculum caenipelagi]|uniref:Outer membrane receptor protein involved in Fe transport n=1 Tax=Tenacibaculum caenipelagi TaxID=1325435 RepID=A0A4R6TID3_9FLAO|nr:TonB-dependent receptor plug domain-containing protein [Tenacibaculum caenipelagi]TDQ29871.1 outer membrane receptor protein involved in Fe transport [Tenacibaculum caenipelagi]